MLKLLIVLAIALVPLVASYYVNVKKDDSWENIDVDLVINQKNNSPSRNNTVYLDQFSVFKELGKGASGAVYLARKNGGSDDGKLYALKAIDISYALYHDKSRPLKTLIEREVLEAVRGNPFTAGLHYAFRQRQWTFLVEDLGIGGDVQTRLKANLPDELTTKLILAELVTAVEKLHDINLLHGDLAYQNTLIDDDGHLILTDFGFAEWKSKDEDSKWDWQTLSMICPEIFGRDVKDESKLSLISLLNNMTDINMQELKNHPYFDGIDWERVSERKSDAPFDPPIVYMNFDSPLNVEELFPLDDEVTETLIERFQNYSYVAPEHQTDHAMSEF